MGECHNGGALPSVGGINAPSPAAALEGYLHELGSAGVALDLGCGAGPWLPRLRAAGLVPIGIEPEAARARTAARVAPVLVADGQRLPLRDGSVDVVWSLQVLHHVPDPAQALAEVRRVLRSGGHLLLAETVEDSPGVRLARRLHPAWDGVPVRSRFDTTALFSMLEGAGLSVVTSRHHSPITFAGLVLPVGGTVVWSVLSRIERRFPGINRWGAHVDCLARAP